MQTVPDNGVPLPLRQVSANSVEIRKGGGWLTALGVPVLASGVFVLLVAARVLPLELTGTGAQAWIGLNGLALAAFGAFLVFGRQRVTIDVSRGTVVRQREAIVPITSLERSLAEFNAVVIAFQAGDGETPDRYPVLLRSFSGKDFRINSTSSFADSRRQAEYLSRWLRLPLADTTTDHVTVVNPAYASASLAERAEKEDFSAPLPPRMRSRIEESKGRAQIVIPARRSLSAWIVAAIFPALAAVLFTPALRRLDHQGGAQSWALFFGFVGFPLLVAALNVLGSRQGKVVVNASAAGLEIVRQGRRAQTTSLPANDILDVDQITFQAESAGARYAKLGRLLRSKGIIVKSRQGLIAFGEGLPAGELRYLTAVLRKALAGQL